MRAFGPVFVLAFLCARSAALAAEAEPSAMLGEPAPAQAAGHEAAAGQQAEGTTLSPNSVIEHVQIAHGANDAELASLLRLGHANYDKGDYETAAIAFMQVLAEKAAPEQDREAMLWLARAYRKKADFTKAAAVYERFAHDYPADAELPAVYLELGRTLRALGAYKQAVSRFYSVLNSTLKVPDGNTDLYRQLARTAQFEIADTYFQCGDFAEANHFFSRLKLLDLAPEDRARAHFKSIYSLSLAAEDEKAVAEIRNFLTSYPDDENVPEARYLLSVSLRRMGQNQESLRATLDLLREENSRTQKDPQRWAYWQRKTGNQLANDFYQAGDFKNAMAIYEDLTRLSTEPAWALPANYQLGLCYERLRRFDKAKACYQTIVEQTKNPPEGGSLAPELTELAEMANWRLSQLDWESTTDMRISSLFSSDPQHNPGASTGTKTLTTTAADHDHHGNPAVASHALR